MNNIEHDIAGATTPPGDKIKLPKTAIRRPHIHKHVEQFWIDKLSSDNPRFLETDLIDSIAKVVGFAPHDAQRVMRDLRNKRRVNYRTVNRRLGLYTCLPLDPLPTSGRIATVAQ